MARHMTIRAVLCVAVSRGWKLHQLDAIQAGEPQGTVHLTPPPGFTNASNPRPACLVRKRLQNLGKFLSVLGFTTSHADSSLFILRQSDSLILLLLCGDDVAIITGSNPYLVTILIIRLSHDLHFHDSGELHCFLGIQVIRHCFGLILSQESFCRGILKSASMEFTTPFNTPLESNFLLSKTSGLPLSSTESNLYRRICSSLQRATLTRPDLSFAVTKLCHFMNRPTDLHLHALKRLLRYLNGTINKGLYITFDTLTFVTAYSDADWGGCPDDRKSIGGYLIFLGKNLVGWESKKQADACSSVKEAEFKAVADVCVELEWIKILLREIGVVLLKSPQVWCDNDGAVKISSDPTFEPRTRHVELDFDYVRFLVLHRFVTISALSSLDQMADILTKPLTPMWFMFYRDKLRLISVSSSENEGRSPVLPAAGMFPLELVEAENEASSSAK